MNNFPVKYTVLKLVDYKGHLLGYCACKCYLKTESTVYYMDKDPVKKCIVIVQNKRLDGAFIGDKIEFVANIGMCYNVSNVYESYDEALNAASSLNQQMFSDIVSKEYVKCNGENFDCKKEILKHKEKMQICQNATKTLHFDMEIENLKSR